MRWTALAPWITERCMRGSTSSSRVARFPPRLSGKGLRNGQRHRGWCAVAVAGVLSQGGLAVSAQAHRRTFCCALGQVQRMTATLLHWVARCSCLATRRGRSPRREASADSRRQSRGHPSEERRELSNEAGTARCELGGLPTSASSGSNATVWIASYARSYRTA